LSDFEGWKKILKDIRKILQGQFLIAKLGIEGIFIEEAVKQVNQSGWDGVTLINTVRGLHFNGEKMILGGLSGPILKPIALRAVYEVRNKFPNIFIIASGGVYNFEDAEEFLKVGANAVGVGSALFKNPEIVEKIGEKFLEVL